LQHAELILGNNVDQTEPLLQPLDDLALALVDARDASLNTPPELPHRLDLLLRPVDPSPPRRRAVRDPQRARDEFRHPRLAVVREEEVGAVEDRGEPVERDDLVPVDGETLLVVLSLETGVVEQRKPDHLEQERAGVVDLHRAAYLVP
jgi:hypothetical protein